VTRKDRKVVTTEVHPTRSSVAIARVFGLREPRTLERKQLVDKKGKSIASGFQRRKA
jgi:hypothetical protein